MDLEAQVSQFRIQKGYLALNCFHYIWAVYGGI